MAAKPEGKLAIVFDSPPWSRQRSIPRAHALFTSPLHVRIRSNINFRQTLHVRHSQQPGFNQGQQRCGAAFELRIDDFLLATQDIYDFFFDVNTNLVAKGLERLDDTLRPAIMSGVLSDMLTASLAKHSRTLVVNSYFNGHPDLVVRGKYPLNAAKAGEFGVEVKTTRKSGGAVDTHGARNQWMCVFVYGVDTVTEPAIARLPMRFTEIYLGEVQVEDFRKNARGELGTRTATLHAKGIAKLRTNWIYRQ